MKLNLLTSSLVVGLVLNSFSAFAAPTNDAEKVQDMSDPLAVYTQAGFGVTNKGLNLKVGQTYDTGNPETMAMNILEVKGFGGEALGWSGSSTRDDSIDSVRLRNFQVNTKNGRGSQLDLNYSVEQQSLDASYSFIQALPEFAGVNLYPLAGLGVRVKNGHFTGDELDEASDGDIVLDEQYVGYTIPGVYAVVGAYSKYSITDKFWLNYSPMFVTPLAGSDTWMDADSVFLNEFAVNYQFTPRFNVRYFADWTSDQSYFEGNQRIEMNYQF